MNKYDSLSIAGKCRLNELQYQLIENLHYVRRYEFGGLLKSTNECLRLLKSVIEELQEIGLEEKEDE